jgi:hypothetical protein
VHREEVYSTAHHELISKPISNQTLDAIGPRVDIFDFIISEKCGNKHFGKASLRKFWIFLRERGLDKN